MGTAQLITFCLGWVFLLASWMWPSKKWGKYSVKIALSWVSFGIFLAGTIHILFN